MAGLAQKYKVNDNQRKCAETYISNGYDIAKAAAELDMLPQNLRKIISKPKVKEFIEELRVEKKETKSFFETFSTLEFLLHERKRIYSSAPEPEDLLLTVEKAVKLSAGVSDDKVKSISKAVKKELDDFIMVQSFRSKELKNMEAFQKNFGDMLEEEIDNFKHKSSDELIDMFKESLNVIETFQKSKQEGLSV